MDGEGAGVTPSPALSLPLKGRGPAEEEGEFAAQSVAAPERAVPAKVSKKGWSDAWGNIDVDHPHIPPEVKARELEKRRRRAEEEAARNNPRLLLNYMHSTVGQPNPPWPRELARAGGRGAQRFAITEDDPHGTNGSDY